MGCKKIYISVLYNDRTYLFRFVQFMIRAVSFRKAIWVSTKMLPQEHCDDLLVISILHFNQIECEKVFPPMAISSVGVIEFLCKMHTFERTTRFPVRNLPPTHDRRISITSFYAHKIYFSYGYKSDDRFYLERCENRECMSYNRGSIAHDTCPKESSVVRVTREG